MKARFLLFAALACCMLAGSACAQVGVKIIGTSLIDNTYIYGRNFAAPPTKTSRIALPVGRNLLGLGPGVSKIKFPADGTITLRAVTVDNYESGTNADGRYALVSGLDINGQYAVGQGSLPGVAFVADGVELDGEWGVVENCHIHGFSGIGATSRGWLRVRESFIDKCFTGIALGTDSVSSGNTVSDCRDKGIWVIAGAGNCQSVGNHYYAINNGGVGAPDFVATDGNAGYIEGGGYKATGDIYADSYRGLVLLGTTAQIQACKFQYNVSRDVRIAGAMNHLADCQVLVHPSTTAYNGKFGVVFEAARCSFLGGWVQIDSDDRALTAVGETTAFWIGGDAHLTKIETMLVDAHTLPATGIEIVGFPTGVRIDCTVFGFNGDSDCLLEVAGAVQDIEATFHGDFDDLTNPGTETAGIKQYIDIPAGWTGAITLIDSTDGTTVTLTEGAAY